MSTTVSWEQMTNHGCLYQRNYSYRAFGACEVRVSNGGGIPRGTYSTHHGIAVLEERGGCVQCHIVEVSAWSGYRGGRGGGSIQRRISLDGHQARIPGNKVSVTIKVTVGSLSADRS